MELNYGGSKELATGQSLSLENVPVSQNVLAPPKRHQPAREQWADLKILIHTLYIEQDKTLEEVVDEIAKQYGFRLTKHQFTRKVGEWGFFKNNSKREARQGLSRSGAGPNESRVNQPPGRRLDILKREKRRRELLNEDPASQLSIISASDAPLGASAQLQVDEEMNATSHSIDVDGPSNDIELINRDTDDNVHSLTYSESWSCVDLPGSPKMRRFLKLIKLEIDAPAEDIKSLDLFGPKFTPPTKLTRRFISNSDLMTLCKAGNSPNHPIVDDIFQTSNHCFGNPSTPFKFRLDVWFPSGVELLPSPFNELYPFPTAEKEDSLSARSSTDSENYNLPLQERQLSDDLHKLQQIWPGSNFLISEKFLELAHVYRQLSKLQEVADICEKVISIQKSLGQETSRIALEAEVMLNQVFHIRGKGHEVLKRHERTHIKVMHSLPPGHSISLISLLLQALATWRTGDFERSEDLFRNILQISLEAYGLNDERTLWAIHGLSNIMITRGRFDDFKNLLGIAIDLLNTFSCSPRHSCICLYQITLATEQQGRYLEALGLSRKLVSMATLQLGEEALLTCAGCELLGRLLFKTDNFEESEKVRESSVMRYLKLYGEKSKSTVCALMNYGNTLIEREKYEHAIDAYKQALSISLTMYGLADDSTIYCSGRLAFCYEIRERFVEALSLLEGLESGVRTAMGDAHPQLVWIQNQISRLQGIIDDAGETEDESSDDSDEMSKASADGALEDSIFEASSNCEHPNLNIEMDQQMKDVYGQDLVKDDVLSQWTTL